MTSQRVAATIDHDHVYCSCHDCQQIRLDALRAGLSDLERCTQCDRYELASLMERVQLRTGNLTYTASSVCPRCAQTF